MSRPVTLFTGQWADLPFEEICQKASMWGYDGLEIACWGDHMDVRKAATDPAYAKNRRQILDKYNLGCWALGAHLAGRPVHVPEGVGRAGVLRRPHDAALLVDPGRLRDVDDVIELGDVMVAIDHTGIGG